MFNQQGRCAPPGEARCEPVRSSGPSAPYLVPESAFHRFTSWPSSSFHAHQDATLGCGGPDQHVASRLAERARGSMGVILYTVYISINRHIALDCVSPGNTDCPIVPYTHSLPPTPRRCDDSHVPHNLTRRLPKHGRWRAVYFERRPYLALHGDEIEIAICSGCSATTSAERASGIQSCLQEARAVREPSHARKDKVVAIAAGPETTQAIRLRGIKHYRTRRKRQ